jgi:hypothetical protein
MNEALKASLPQDLFNPERMPARDGTGMCWHPDYDLIYNGLGVDDEGEAAWKFLQEMGYEYAAYYMENDIEPDEYDRYCEDDGRSFAFWQPSKPEGDGWLMLGMCVIEDGPCVWYLRLAQEAVPA